MLPSAAFHVGVKKCGRNQRLRLRDWATSEEGFGDAMNDDARKKLLSLIEFGIVGVTLIALALLVVPSMSRSIKQRRSAEASENVRVLFQLATDYYTKKVEANGGDNFDVRFPASMDAPHPAEPSTKAVSTSDWHMVPAFRELGFELKNPHFYQYQFTSEGEGDGARFMISAFGDLDGDGHKSRFQMEGYIENGEVRGNAITVDRLE